jgi:hypothetical protein
MNRLLLAFVRNSSQHLKGITLHLLVERNLSLHYKICKLKACMLTYPY